MGRDPQAAWEPSPNYWQGRGGHKAQWIILHGTASGNNATTGGALSWLKNPVSQVSAHYVINIDGSLHQLVDESDSAWANGILEDNHDVWWSAAINPNVQTISIEHENLTQYNTNALTDAQKKTSLALIGRICDRNGIPRRLANSAGGITGHYSIAPGSRAKCPGNYPWNELWAALQKGETTMGVPVGWTDDGTTLTAPNGIKVVRGFREFVLANNWNKDNWPETAEYAANPLELSNPPLGAGTQQIFRLCLLGWTKERGIIVEYIGQEFLFCRQLLVQYAQQITQYKAQIDTLTKQVQNSANLQQAALHQIYAIASQFEVKNG